MSAWSDSGSGEVSLCRPLDEHACVLLRVERIAGRLCEQTRPDLAANGRLVEERPEQCHGLFRRQRIDHRHVPPAGSPLEQLGPRGGDDRERDVRAPVGEVLDEIEHPVVGPVEVFDREHEQTAVARDAGDVPAPGGERLALVAGLAAEADERAEWRSTQSASLRSDTAAVTDVRRRSAATDAESVSRIPACAFTISPKAQKVTPAP